ncbi:MAG TPA: hypothetical protein VF618_27805 [Thermoanaerobaculia bacterium]
MQRQNAPETCNDHYLFWKVRETGVDFKVKLQTAADQAPFDTALLQIEYLGNPARKTREGREPEDVHHPSLHLLAYKLGIQREAPERSVFVSNQFGQGQQWQLGNSQYLLMPARKAKGDEPDPTSPPPPRVDHFLCFRVVEGQAIEETFAVRDQFGEYRFVYLKPILFGYPVSKNDEGTVHPDVYQAIYEVTEVVRPPAHVGVRTLDQLGKLALNAVETAWFGVPSLKAMKG